MRPPPVFSLLLSVLALLAAGRGGLAQQPWIARDYRLPNGLRVLLAPDPLAPTVAVCVVYRVGSRDETPGQSGWAHLLEHMAFQGSAHVGRGEHRLLVQGTGGTFGADTTQDYTEFYETLPANQLPLALFLEADRMAGLDMTRPNLDNQRAVVEAERSEHHSHQAHDVARVALLRLSYARFAYRHPTIGETADLDAASLAGLGAFYHTYYAPNNAVLVVAGRFDPAVTEHGIAGRFGAIPRRPPPPPADVAEAPPRAERRLALKDDYSRLQRCVLSFRVPPADDPDTEALGLLADVLGRGRTGRLYRSLVEPRQAVGVSAYVQGRQGPSLFVIAVDLPAGSAYGAAENAVEAEIARVQASGITPAELRRAKNWARMDRWEWCQTSVGRAGLLGREAAGDDAGRVNTFEARLKAVTADTIRQVARRYLIPRSRVVLSVTPTAY